MDDARTRLLAGLVGPCPECRNGTLEAVSDGDQTNFLCVNCGRCWHPEMAWVSRVDPVTCPGCPSRPTCLESRRRYGPAVASTEIAGAPAPVTLRGTAAPTDG